jgi:putative membrane protein
MRHRWLLIGSIILLALWLLLLLDFASDSFTGHMLVHMGVVAVAAPLIALGIAGTRYDVIARTRWITPLSASLLELVLVWIWHAPVMRRASDASFWVSGLEQASFLAGGLVLWLACLCGLKAGTLAGRLGGAVGLILTSIHMTLLGVLLTMSPRPLYGEDFVTCFGLTLSPGQDQQLGGIVMLLDGAAAYLAGGVALLAGVLGRDPPEPAKGAL